MSRVRTKFSRRIKQTRAVTLSLLTAAMGSWLRCQFHTAVVSFRKSMRPWPKLGSRKADHTCRAAVPRVCGT